MIDRRALELWGLVAVLVITSPAMAAPEGGSARLIPAKDLRQYVEYDGLNAHADAWKRTAAYAVLNRTGTGVMLIDLATQVANWRLKPGPGSRPTGKEIFALFEHVVRRGFAVGVDRTGIGVVVLPGAGRAEPRERLEELLKRAAKASGYSISDPVRIRGRQVVEVRRLDTWPADFREHRVELLKDNPKLFGEYEPGPQQAWWVEGEDLIIILGAGKDRFEIVINAIEGKSPSVAAHPVRIALAKARGALDFEPAGLFFIEPANEQAGDSLKLPGALGMAPLPIPSKDGVEYFNGALSASPVPTQETALPPQRASAPQPAAPDQNPFAPAKLPERPVPPKPPFDPMPNFGEIMELAGIKRISGQWGFQGKALASDLLVEASAPRADHTVLFDQPSFRKDPLPPIPKGVTGFTIVSLEPDKIYEAGLALAGMASLGSREELDNLEQTLSLMIGVRLRQDVLNKLGPTWAYYEDPDARLDGENRGVNQLVLLAGVRDGSGFARTLDTLAKGVNKAFRDAEGNDNDREAPALELKPLPAPVRGYILTSAAGRISLFSKTFRPTVMVGASYVAFAFTPEQAGRALEAESKNGAHWAPAGPLVETFQRLPETLTFLAVGNPRNSLVPRLIQDLPTIVQFMGVAAELDDAPGKSPVSELRAMFNLPRPGGFQIRYGEDKIPKAAQVEAQMFPSMLAATVDRLGLRVIGRQALPLDTLGLANVIDFSTSRVVGESTKFKASIRLK